MPQALKLVAAWCIAPEPIEKTGFSGPDRKGLCHLARTTGEVQDLEALNSAGAFGVPR